MQRRQLLGSSLGLLALTPPGRAAEPVAPATSVRAPLVRIGYVSPQTGVLASFGQTDKWTLHALSGIFRQAVTFAGERSRVEVLLRDSGSTREGAAQAARSLIQQDRVQLMLASATPETTIPVSAACEAAGVPCITTNAPWQPWFYRPGIDPARGWEWTFHFFWGLDEVAEVCLGLWEKSAAGRRVGGLLTDDEDGRAWAHPEQGLEPRLTGRGFQLVRSAPIDAAGAGLTAALTQFEKTGCQIVTGVLNPPMAATALQTCAKSPRRPRVVTVFKGALVPEAAKALGPLAHGLTTELFWSPDFLHQSSLTGMNCRELANYWEAFTGQRWSQFLGTNHALFEVALQALRQAVEPTPDGIRRGLAKFRLKTVAGWVAWGGSGSARNVGRIPLAGGQWQPQARNGELVLRTAYVAHPEVASTVSELIPWQPA